jgi:hypothetical protein
MAAFERRAASPLRISIVRFLPMPSSLNRTLLVLLLASASACGSQPSEAPPPQAPAGKKVDAATAGSIAGKVTFTGKPPAAEKVRMTSDPGCVQGAGPNPQSDAVLIAGDGSLRNVFVYLKDGLDASYTFEAPAAPAVLDQKGCFYTPRVLGVRIGQPIALTNSDPTFHNVHALPKTNREFNTGLNPGTPATRRTFTAAEVMVRFKCDVHGWMAAYVGVVAHPYFAVTGNDGSFKLDGVPPGTYTVEAWHERFGTKTAQVTVGDRQAETVPFTCAAE